MAGHGRRQSTTRKSKDGGTSRKKKPGVDTTGSISKAAERPADAGSAADQITRQLAGEALSKIQSGLQPTAREVSALKRYERTKEEEQRWGFYRAIPQRHWREMSGRQTKVLHEQAERYGIPFGGASICLPDVVRAVHELLAKHGRKLLAGNGEDDPLLAGPVSPALERYRAARADREELAYERDLGKWMERDKVHEALAKLAKLLRDAGDALQRQHGQDALAILQESLADFDREVARTFGRSTDGQTV